MGKFIQWTSYNNDYYPAGPVAKDLPPGYYNINQSMSGLYFTRKEIKTESLFRFPDTSGDKVINEINNFWSLESKFRDNGLPYKRGILMYGPPGSGKTSVIRIVIDEMVSKHDGIIIEFPSIYLFKEAYEALREIHPNVRIIVLMEDLDQVMNHTSQPDMLNLLDGVYRIHNVIFLATTNYPEKLKSNIMNRPTRFDKKIFMGMPNEEARRIFIKNKLVNDDVSIIDQWVKDTKGMSIAHIKELFIANRILNEPYSVALETISRMGEFISSSEFDEYQSKSCKIQESKSNHKDRHSSILESCGNGNVYKSLRRAMKRTGSGPEDIARAIS